MKKIFLLPALLLIIGLSAARACTCDPWAGSFKETLMRSSLGFFGHPDTVPYVIRTYMVAHNADSFRSELFVVQQYRGQHALDTAIYRNGNGANCYDNYYGAAGDTVIALILRIKTDMFNIDPPFYEGEFVNYWCNQNFMRIQNDSVVNWDGVNGPTFPLSQLQDSIDYVFAHPVSVQEINEHYGLQVFPNPAGDVLHINAAGMDVQQIDLLDVNGRVLSAQTVKNNSTSINIATLSPGLYVVAVKNKEGRMYYKKIMKR